jgi:hypothetical protein
VCDWGPQIKGTNNKNKTSTICCGRRHRLKAVLVFGFSAPHSHPSRCLSQPPVDDRQAGAQGGQSCVQCHSANAQSSSWDTNSNHPQIPELPVLIGNQADHRNCRRAGECLLNPRSFLKSEVLGRELSHLVRR